MPCVSTFEADGASRGRCFRATGASSGPSVQNETNIDGAEKKGRTSGASLGRSAGRVRGVAGVFGDDAPPTATVVEFTRVWWDFNSGAHSRLSVWRPSCPDGFVSLGDVAVAELQPPASGRRPDAPGRRRDAGTRTVGLPWRGPSIGRCCGATQVGARGKSRAISFWKRFPDGYGPSDTSREPRRPAARDVRVPPRGSGDDRPEGGFERAPRGRGAGSNWGESPSRFSAPRTRLTSSPLPPRPTEDRPTGDARNPSTATTCRSVPSTP